jgi:hypothetical protein
MSCPDCNVNTSLFVSGQHIFIDGSKGTLPRLRIMYVKGWLEFSNDKDTDNIHLKATHVVVLAGRIFTSGSKPNQPMNGCLKIELYGNHSTPEINIQGAPKVGAKALG